VHDAPFYVLRPLVTDIAPGSDHITSAIAPPCGLARRQHALLRHPQGAPRPAQSRGTSAKGDCLQANRRPTPDPASPSPGRAHPSSDALSPPGVLHWRTIRLALDPETARRLHDETLLPQAGRVSIRPRLQHVRPTLSARCGSARTPQTRPTAAALVAARGSIKIVNRPSTSPAASPGTGISSCSSCDWGGTAGSSLPFRSLKGRSVVPRPRNRPPRLNSHLIATRDRDRLRPVSKSTQSPTVLGVSRPFPSTWCSGRTSQRRLTLESTACRARCFPSFSGATGVHRDPPSWSFSLRRPRVRPPGRSAAVRKIGA